MCRSEVPRVELQNEQLVLFEHPVLRQEWPEAIGRH